MFGGTRSEEEAEEAEAEEEEEGADRAREESTKPHGSFALVLRSAATPRCLLTSSSKLGLPMPRSTDHIGLHHSCFPFGVFPITWTNVSGKWER